jgi:hypothetical protein
MVTVAKASATSRKRKRLGMSNLLDSRREAGG